MLKPTLGGVIASATVALMSWGGFTVGLVILAAGVLVGAVIYIWMKLEELGETTQGLAGSVDTLQDKVSSLDQKLREGG